MRRAGWLLVSAFSRSSGSSCPKVVQWSHLDSRASCRQHVMVSSSMLSSVFAVGSSGRDAWRLAEIGNGRRCRGRPSSRVSAQPICSKALTTNEELKAMRRQMRWVLAADWDTSVATVHDSSHHARRITSHLDERLHRYAIPR